jgi:hypothetical protein
LVLRPVRALRVLAYPPLALALWIAIICMWHLPALYQAALANPAVHALEHASFFAAGLAMWAAVIEPLPGPLWAATGSGFDTGTLQKGQSGSHTFSQAGSFPYVCTIHPFMHGTITVK